MYNAYRSNTVGVGRPIKLSCWNGNDRQRALFPPEPTFPDYPHYWWQLSNNYQVVLNLNVIDPTVARNDKANKFIMDPITGSYPGHSQLSLWVSCAHCR